MNDIILTTGMKRIAVNRDEPINIGVSLSTKNSPDDYHDTGKFQTRLCAVLYSGENMLNEKVCPLPVDHLLKTYNGTYNFHFNAPEQSGRYRIIVTLKTSVIGTWSIKKTINLIVRDK
jgi:hypothetical protein